MVDHWFEGFFDWICSFWDIIFHKWPFLAWYGLFLTPFSIIKGGQGGLQLQNYVPLGAHILHTPNYDSNQVYKKTISKFEAIMPELWDCIDWNVYG